MMENNYRYSCRLLESSLELGVPFLYASSAAVYGAGRTFREARQYERPLNVYGYSKFLFDQRVRRALPQARSQVVGLRYFNVYGPREEHKGRMASVAYHCYQQLRRDGRVELFGEHGGFRPAATCATSSRWRTWRGSTCISSIIRSVRESSTSAAARRGPSTRSPWR